jgi:hypothetical protein
VVSITPDQLPHRETADVNVEHVEMRGAATIAGELHLELHLGLGDGSVADGARGAYPRSAPKAVWWAAGELPFLQVLAGFLAERGFVFHLGRLLSVQ